MHSLVHAEKGVSKRPEIEKEAKALKEEEKWYVFKNFLREFR